MINELAKQIHQNAVDKGFFEKERNIGEMLCLIHSEVSEALEAERTGSYADIGYYENKCAEFPDNELRNKTLFETQIKNTFEDELADIMIRVMDLAAFKGIDLEKHIKLKMQYNSQREKYHGKKF